ncbi:hypothetical protein DVH26_07610 [Paenibacillus sp. H1-7]|uniref:LytTR family transcriptional regulator DNA-binding domain-containing protein n=1 Tax=Paenibacillus sp. H1-7 TaxID=2282849 RepID=UPI001EF917A7|nr:LytTR family transcriptional regulator DNA-binding domain-containing protein [Paenibacillus sp. H1-7]ULL14324.1 hypothetical protein DVH26_07610 [Paenibacillus sp. H1-7]
MEIPVYCTTNKKTTTIHLEDILFINVNNNKITIQTKDGIYRPLIALKEYAELFKEHGFEKLENSTLVHVDKITRFDKYSKIAFFDNDGHPTKACYVSRRNLKKLKHLKK